MERYALLVRAFWVPLAFWGALMVSMWLATALSARRP